MSASRKIISKLIEKSQENRHQYFVGKNTVSLHRDGLPYQLIF